jgi:tryptophan synthase beta chain
MDTIKYTLLENQMPQSWYNIQADLSTPMAPVLHPATHQPITAKDLEPLIAVARCWFDKEHSPHN